MKNSLLIMISASIVCQFLAAFLAVRLIPLSGTFMVWIFLACGFIIQAIRRTDSLINILYGRSAGDMWIESMGLIISILMLCGLWKFKQLFSEIKRSKQEMIEKQAELEAINRKQEQEGAERQIAEKALSENEQKFRIVADYSYDWEYWIDADGCFRYISPYCKEVCGYDAEEFYRDPQLLQKIIYPDDTKVYETHLTESCNENGSAGPVEFRITTKDGQIRWIEHACRPVLDSSGKPSGRRSSNRDVTKRKQAEQLLRESEERYRHLYNETPVMIHSIDQNGRLVSVSNYWLKTLDYERSEVIGRKSLEFLTEESRRYAEEIVLPDFFRTGFCIEVPYRMVKKNGEIIDVLLSATAERNDEGDIVRSLAVMIDVTERNQNQKKIETLNTELAERAGELENANRELEAFSYTVSHDLRTPLAIIGGYSQLIQNKYCNNMDSQGREYLDIIYENCLNMEKLIDALLKFSLLTHAEVSREDVDLSKIADIVAAELALTDTGHRVTFRISRGITANGDADLLQIVLENLLGNAWKYTGKQEEALIEFGMNIMDGTRIYFVRDNGPGFDKSNAERLFLPFQRLPGAEKSKGFGIGLATVERIVSRHGGKVWAEAETGKGATFYFTLSE